MFWSAITFADLLSPTADRPSLPPFVADKVTLPFILPAIPFGNEAEGSKVPAVTQILIKKINIIGNTVLSYTELAELSKPYLNRTLSYSDLQKLRDELTAAYIRQGYITSGAILPDQTIINNTVEFHIIEGILSTTEVKTDGRFRENTIKRQLESAADPVVNIIALEQQLQLLQRDHRIRKVNAELVPGSESGESELFVFLEEETPYSFSVGANNLHSPTIGAEGGHVSLYHGNVTGIGDQIFVDIDFTEGLREIVANYEIPLGPSGTSIDFYIQSVETEIIDNNFDDLDIEGRSESYAITLKQTIFQTFENHIELFLTGEYRQSRSFLLGSGFSFSDGPDNGVSKIAVVRFGQNWTYGDSHQVFAARTTLSLGLDTLGATKNSGNIPDGQFLSILGQFQWARQFDFMDSKLIVRTDFQFSDSPLLGIEQFSVGGYGTVRGYRENLLVRDNGIVGSIEYRVPVWHSDTPDVLVEVASFADAGYSSNKNRPTIGPRNLSSVGLGLLGAVSKYATFQFYWGYGFRNIDIRQESNPQDDGFHFITQFRWP